MLIAQAAGNTDFNSAVATLGLSFPIFLCSIFCLWPTQDNNIYGGSLAIQNMFQGTALEGYLSHRLLACILACLSAIFAAAGAAVQHLLPIVITLSVLLPPVPGMIFGEYFFVKSSRERKSGNWIAIVSWVLSSLLSYVALKNDFFIPPVIGILSACFCYTLLSTLCRKPHRAGQY